MPAVAATDEDRKLAGMIAEYYDDPLNFVRECFAGQVEPDTWQRQFLEDVGAAVKLGKYPLRFAVASGHGIGKSTLIAWIACWLMATRPSTVGTITANTNDQLSTKTWAAIQKWHKLLICGPWFDINSEKMRAKEAPERWKLTCQTCVAENSEAFAGQHSDIPQGTSVYLIDEASAVPDIIDEVSDGGLTAGEDMKFAFGNPTRNTGWFHAACFGNQRHKWDHRSIDSRTSRFTNKDEIDLMIQEWGLDSDRVRVRVLGLPPKQAESQFISRSVIEAARKRTTYTLPDEPLIAGVDVADGGGAWFIVRFRRGRDADVCMPIRIPGSRIDRPAMIGLLAQMLRDGVEHKILTGMRIPIARMFIDSAFGGPLVERLQNMGYGNVTEVRFGGKSPDSHCANQRAYMWNANKEWLEHGGGCLPAEDEKLAVDLGSPGYSRNVRDQLVIESKQDMIADGRPSPDDGDALVLTFAAPVAIPQREAPRGGYSKWGADSWMA